MANKMARTVASFMVLAAFSISGGIFSRAFGQTAVTQPAFDVASIKPSKLMKDRKSINVNPGGISYTNVTLRDCIQAAYEVKYFQVAGPDWINTERYDIVAKAVDGVSNDRFMTMLQTLLADRFKLALHREKKEIPVYVMFTGKNGPKFHVSESAEDSGPQFSPAGMTMRGTTMQGLADFLSKMHSSDRPILDRTGLTGRYDITVKFDLQPDMSPMETKKAMIEWTQGSGLFADVQSQLGLKLEAQKAPFDVIVVDRGEKIPTEN